MHVSQISHLVPFDAELTEVAEAPHADPIYVQIGTYVAGLIEDGNTLQAGIGTELKPGVGVVTTRDVHYVVTEHGIADLHGKTIRQRARALIDSVPTVRAELAAAAEALHFL